MHMLMHICIYAYAYIRKRQKVEVGSRSAVGAHLHIYAKHFTSKQMNITLPSD